MCTAYPPVETEVPSYSAYTYTDRSGSAVYEIILLHTPLMHGRPNLSGMVYVHSYLGRWLPSCVRMQVPVRS